MEAEWFDLAQNLLSISGAAFILRYIAIALKDGVSRVWRDCVERDKRNNRLKAIELQHNYWLERDHIRYVSARGANTWQFRDERDNET